MHYTDSNSTPCLSSSPLQKNIKPEVSRVEVKQWHLTSYRNTHALLTNSLIKPWNIHVFLKTFWSGEMKSATCHTPALTKFCCGIFLLLCSHASHDEGNHSEECPIILQAHWPAWAAWNTQGNLGHYPNQAEPEYFTLWALHFLYPPHPPKQWSCKSYTPPFRVQAQAYRNSPVL